MTAFYKNFCFVFLFAEIYDLDDLKHELHTSQKDFAKTDQDTGNTLFLEPFKKA